MITSDKSRRVITGGAVVLIIFFIFNELLLPWYVGHGDTVEVPDLIGVDSLAAMEILDSVGLSGRAAGYSVDRTHKAGLVIRQTPLAGHSVKVGRRIYLTVSSGEQLVPVPSVRGRTLRDAAFLLERAGLKMGGVIYEPSDEYPVNTIMEQQIASGTEVRKDTRLDITVSMGPLSQSVAVPSVIGLTLSEAIIALEKAGIKPGNMTYVPAPDFLPNTVLEQYPAPGEMVRRQQAVDLVIVRGAARQDLIEY